MLRLERHPSLRATFNLVPSLVDQIEDAVAGVPDDRSSAARSVAARRPCAAEIRRCRMFAAARANAGRGSVSWSTPPRRLRGPCAPAALEGGSCWRGSIHTSATQAVALVVPRPGGGTDACSLHAPDEVLPAAGSREGRSCRPALLPPDPVADRGLALRSAPTSWRRSNRSWLGRAAAVRGGWSACPGSRRAGGHVAVRGRIPKWWHCGRVRPALARDRRAVRRSLPPDGAASAALSRGASGRCTATPRCSATVSTDRLRTSAGTPPKRRAISCSACAGSAPVRGREPLVVVILDGVCWEAYAETVRRSDALYNAAAAPDVRTATPSQVLVSAVDRRAAGRALVDRRGLSHLIGHPEKNRGWSCWRGRAARWCNRAPPPDIRGVGILQRRPDWFWWYGDDHYTVDRMSSTALQHLRCTARAAGAAAACRSRGPPAIRRTRNRSARSIHDRRRRTSYWHSAGACGSTLWRCHAPRRCDDARAAPWLRHRVLLPAARPERAVAWRTLGLRCRTGADASRSRTSAWRIEPVMRADGAVERREGCRAGRSWSWKAAGAARARLARLEMRGAARPGPIEPAAGRRAATGRPEEARLWSAS